MSAASRAQPGSRHHDGINSRRRPNGAYTAYHQHWTLHARVTQAVLATLCSGAIPQSHMSCRNFSRPFCSCYPSPLAVFRTMFKCRSAVATSASKSCIRRFSWLKAATTAFTFKTLLRHYAKRALIPRSLNVKLGPRRKGHKGRAVWLA